ncbi:PAS domain-containing protein [Pseudodesulfovibrio sp. F-1]|uniref:PAS domain-containing protein n=1 Tax=Pseudodesulfovibrio alkaliphilus TaxID=2661613 RepID=A0A7K1KQT5_9BACT|nr:methyl-accepting chemotaxis protein [Pseudodesulfovibrio alkaliphilus]MUM78330.1 PAS domain-containing protein [Pseudodesulfovibrio alkaliphilus]
MSIGPRSIIVLLGCAAIACFAGAALVGGWAAFGGAAALIMLLSAVAVWLVVRDNNRLQEAVESLTVGDEDGAVLPVLAGLGEALGALRGEKGLLETALKALGNPAFLCNREGRILLVNKALLDMLGKPSAQVVGFPVGQAVYGKGDSLTEKALRSAKSVAEDAEVSLWDGRRAILKCFVSPLHDEAGKLTGAVTSFVDLAEVVEQRREVERQRERMAQAGQQISTLAEHVASATELLSAAADEQAQGAQKQRNQTSSVATAMEEMTATVIEVARNASATSDAAGKAQESATEGASMVSRAVEAINEVSEAAGQLGHEIGELDAQAGEIGRIISVINDIADQTNLLALNAAIEAARAGEAGRGFAVVADEVRKLAEKTMAATKEVEEAIGTIQSRSRHATEAMRRTEQRVAESTSLSNQAGEALQHIMGSIGDMVGRVTQIATAAEQQSSAAEDIGRSIEDIAEIAGEADEAAGQAASATRELAGLAQELLEVSNEFRDGGGGSRLRESQGRMKGVLPKLAQAFVRKKYGDKVYDAVQKEMGNPVFLPTESYPDQALLQMAETAAAAAAITVRDFFIEFGKYSIKRFHEMYPRHFKKESLKEFYLRMNDIHAQLTKDQPGIKPPVFTYEDKGEELFMNYKSSRGLFDYFEGILLGAAEFKGEKVTVRVKPFDETSARAEIVFQSKG